MINDDTRHPNRDEAEPNAAEVRRYARALAGWWREVVLVTALTALAGTGLAFVRTPVYEATATVAMLHWRVHFILDEVTEAPETAPSVREALVDLVNSGEVARAVADSLGDDLDETERVPARLLDAVSAGRQSTFRATDLIPIRARADSPRKAEAIATAWAREYVRAANRLYEPFPTSAIATMDAQLAVAQRSYDEAERRLQVFTAAGGRARVEGWLEHQGTVVEELHALLRTRLETAARYAGWRDELRMATFAENYAARERLTRVAASARLLRAHAEVSGEAGVTSNMLAVQLLKAQAFASGPARRSRRTDSIAASPLPLSSFSETLPTAPSVGAEGVTHVIVPVIIDSVTGAGMDQPKSRLDLRAVTKIKLLSQGFSVILAA